MDSALNVYIRCVKALIENAEAELSEREFATLCSILILSLAGKHEVAA